ncbi:hypothetical protein QT318_09065 [Escherichia coli]|nr:hypothetical protein [Escherichia coli]
MSDSSKDAVNGSQLKATNDDVEDQYRQYRY